MKAENAFEDVNILHDSQFHGSYNINSSKNVFFSQQKVILHDSLCANL